jgi:hypothetical protein
MYLWRVDRLVEYFRNDQVTEREKLKYMILYGVLLAAVPEVGLWGAGSMGYEYTHMSAVGVLVGVVITILGTYYCYAKNRDGDNRDFITRIMCIGLPVTIRVIVLFLPAFVVLVILEQVYGIGTRTNEFGQSVSYATWLDVLFAAVSYAVAYLYLAKKMAVVAQAAPAPEQG